MVAFNYMLLGLLERIGVLKNTVFVNMCLCETISHDAVFRGVSWFTERVGYYRERKSERKCVNFRTP